MQYRLADYGLVFSTRDRGAMMRADLLAKLDAAPAADHKIDVEGVLSVSYSFVDEFFGELAQRMGDELPVIVNVPPAIARTIERSLTRRGLDPERVLSSCLQTA